jgi:hypothetical protein
MSVTVMSKAACEHPHSPTVISPFKSAYPHKNNARDLFSIYTVIIDLESSPLGVIVLEALINGPGLVL